jgi:hypothetical protein
VLLVLACLYHLESTTGRIEAAQQCRQHHAAIMAWVLSPSDVAVWQDAPVEEVLDVSTTAST